MVLGRTSKTHRRYIRHKHIHTTYLSRATDRASGNDNVMSDTSRKRCTALHAAEGVGKQYGFRVDIRIRYNNIRYFSVHLYRWLPGGRRRAKEAKTKHEEPTPSSILRHPLQRLADLTRRQRKQFLEPGGVHRRAVRAELVHGRFRAEDFDLVGRFFDFAAAVGEREIRMSDSEREGEGKTRGNRDRNVPTHPTRHALPQGVIRELEVAHPELRRRRRGPRRRLLLLLRSCHGPLNFGRPRCLCSCSRSGRRRRSRHRPRSC